MWALRALARGRERRGLPAVPRPVRDDEHRGRGHDAVARALARPEARRERDRIADRGTFARRERVERVDCERAVGGRRQGDEGARAEADDRNAVLLRDAIEERLCRAPRSLEPGRLHVLRGHRPRHVDREHDGGLLSRDLDVRVRACGSDNEREERDEEDPERDRAAPARALGDEVRQERGRSRTQRPAARAGAPGAARAR